MIDAELPDLVITDLSLPDTSGIEIIHHIRAKSKTMPIIVMSGHNTRRLNEASRPRRRRKRIRSSSQSQYVALAASNHRGPRR